MYSHYIDLYQIIRVIECYIATADKESITWLLTYNIMMTLNILIESD